MSSLTHHWLKRLAESKKPAYLLIADLIEEDIGNDRLRARDRLPGLRELAEELNLNYTTVARAYNEAKKRGLIDSQAGTGTFIRGRAPAIPLRDGSSAEMTMNMPPEPAALTARLKEDAARIIENSDIYSLMRYQDFGGTADDRETASSWLQPFVPQASADRVLVSAGIHSVLLALMSQLARPGELICVEDLVYPGIKAIAAQLGIRLHPIPSDEDGPIPFALEDVCKTQPIRAFYCNPTLQNPSTKTIPLHRRRALADVAMRYNIPIIEDDAYGMLPIRPLVTMAQLAPELTWYVSGFAKCLGAGLRVAYVCAPTARQAQRLAGALRATSVMVSPLSALLVTSWVKNGIAAEMLKAVRAESAARQKIADRVLAAWPHQSHPEGFHLWLPIPINAGWRASEFAHQLRTQGVGVVGSVAFSTDSNPAEAVRICLGGPNSREECESALQLVADTLEYPHHLHMPMM
ncbi:PLP-dependent aminotransferase family protein [Methylobacillus flagellatus]|uniref:aminotransferase-like domain-containing protein n=1 Tax=Methylobacillus flagellatus TaxID=405 RepID=UPI0010F53121|nr:PLP-dependent aminotransferase family protein [Methylobacillus flagellatus]